MPPEPKKVYLIDKYLKYKLLQLDASTCLCINIKCVPCGTKAIFTFNVSQQNALSLSSTKHVECMSFPSLHLQ